MSLLALEHVEKAYGSGPGRHVVLRDVSLEIEAGEMVAVWGLRRSGRSTLLRVAAGIEAPDAGSVRFAGHDLRGRGRGREALGEQIGYCRKAFRPSEGHHVGHPPAIASDLDRASNPIHDAGAADLR